MSSVVRLLFFCLLLLRPLTVSAVIPEPPAQPRGHIVDLASIIDQSDEGKLDRILASLEEQTGIQMVILTVDSLEGEDIGSFSLRIAEQWRLGQKDRDNGLLFSVSVQDRKYRFEVGYGLESVLPDSLVGGIGRQVLVPYFKQGNYSEGIAAATGTVIETLAKTYAIRIDKADQLPTRQPGKKKGDYGGLVFLLIMLFLFIFKIRNNRRYQRGYRSGMSGVPPVIIGGGGWNSGGGFGGGFGGFSGGGGGFGGGGASGGW